MLDFTRDKENAPEAREAEGRGIDLEQIESIRQGLFDGTGIAALAQNIMQKLKDASGRFENMPTPDPTALLGPILDGHTLAEIPTNAMMGALAALGESMQIYARRALLQFAMFRQAAEILEIEGSSEILRDAETDDFIDELRLEDVPENVRDLIDALYMLAEYYRDSHADAPIMSLSEEPYKIELTPEARADAQALAGEYLTFHAQGGSFTNYRESVIAFIERRGGAEGGKPLERLNSILPDKFIMPNNKAINEATRGTAEQLAAGFWLEVIKGKKGRGPSVDSAIRLNYEGDNVRISGRKPFTNYDREVYNAITTLYVYGDPAHNITPAMVYRTMVGSRGTENPSPQQLEAVTESIDKLRFMRVWIDCSAELKQRHATLDGMPITNGVIDTYLLKADKLTVGAGGQSVDAYKIFDAPILYTYAHKVKQVITVPTALLDVREVKKGKATLARISNTQSRILIRAELLRRIEGMKAKNSLSQRAISLVSYDRKEGGRAHHHAGLYEIAGYSNPSKKDAHTVRGYAAQVLDYWIAEKYIKGYQFTKTGRAITGIEIDL